MDKYENREEWLKSLKVGDRVAYSTGSYGFRSYRFDTVAKITPTGRIKLKELINVTFSERGTQMGQVSSWTPRIEIVPATDEIYQFMRLKNMRDCLSKIRVADLPEEELGQIHKILTHLELSKNQGTSHDRQL